MAISSFQLCGDRQFRLIDDLIDVSIDEEMRCLHLLLLPLAADVNAQQLVMFFQDLPEAGVVKVLVVLKENQGEIEFGKCEFEFLLKIFD